MLSENLNCNAEPADENITKNRNFLIIFWNPKTVFFNLQVKVWRRIHINL